MAKSVIALLDGGEDPAGPFRDGLLFGVRYRRGGWGRGLTMHTCMMRLLPNLNPEDRPRALYHGLSAVARDSDGAPPRFILSPLPDTTADVPTLKRWFRRFVEVRDAEGAERCIVSAVRSGADHRTLADMLFSAATDHRYVDIGHPLDFTNKAFEALDLAGWEHAEPVLSSLAQGYANADRMEESNSWRNPVDLVAILKAAFEELPQVLEDGRGRRGQWIGSEALVPMLLGDDPQAIADALLQALRGAPPKWSWLATWLTRRRCASPTSTPATNSETGTPPCTLSPSPTRYKRACGGWPLRTFCVVSSMRP